MKKKGICLFMVLLMLTACGNGNRSVVPDKTTTVVEPEQQVSSGPTEQPKEAVDSFWDQNTVNGIKENNVLSFRTGMQLVLPKAWDGEIVTSVGDGTLTVADKRNVEKGAGGVMFYLSYFDRKGATGEYPYTLDKGFATVIGTYKVNGEEYALVQELPTEMNYVEGNEELKKHYEDLYASVDKVQIITTNMPGFTKCGIDDLNWIIYDPYQ